MFSIAFNNEIVFIYLLCIMVQSLVITKTFQQYSLHFQVYIASSSNMTGKLPERQLIRPTEQFSSWANNSSIGCTQTQLHTEL